MSEKESWRTTRDFFTKFPLSRYVTLQCLLKKKVNSVRDNNGQLDRILDLPPYEVKKNYYYQSTILCWGSTSNMRHGFRRNPTCSISLLAQQNKESGKYSNTQIEILVKNSRNESNTEGTERKRDGEWERGEPGSVTYDPFGYHHDEA